MVVAAIQWSVVWDQKRCSTPQSWQELVAFRVSEMFCHRYQAVLRGRANITAALVNSEGLISLCISETHSQEICSAVLRKIISAVLLFERAEAKQSVYMLNGTILPSREVSQLLMVGLFWIEYALFNRFRKLDFYHCAIRMFKSHIKEASQMSGETSIET